MKKNCWMTLIALTIFAPALHARVNMLELWKNDVDTSLLKKNNYSAGASYLWGERFFEVPFTAAWGAGSNIETEARWGLLSRDGKTGINDLTFGLKCRFMNETADQPAIIGEAGVALPTGDSTNALGTGAVSFLLNWAMKKRIEDVDGYFGFGIRLNNENGDKLRLGNVFFYKAGVSIDHDRNTKLNAEIKGFNHSPCYFDGNKADSSDYQELYLAPGAEYFYKGRSLSGSLLIGLTDKSNDLGLIISTKF